MWVNSKHVRYVYSSSSSKSAYALFDGLSGWKSISKDSNDGVANMVTLLSAANSNNRKVNVYLDGDSVTRAVLT
ncbi:hypothetical protein [Nocardioides sp.]|uniref:hypothetical protein n=1 Tax=Nocardioides sp. TaxID=35761 RepID=UPI0035654BE0